jgi:hypothetical protein
MHGLLSLLAERDRYYPITKALTAYLDAVDLLRIRLVCKDLQGASDDALKTCWKINDYLKPCFTDPVALRYVQATTNALIVWESAFFR